MLRTPREIFIATTWAAEFKTMAQTVAFEQATITAMLELQNEMPLECSPNVAATSHDQISGARRYMTILHSLWQPQATVKPATQKGLNYSAGV